jgi:hypothetical protein
VTDVAYLTSAEQAKTDCIANSGVLKSKLELQGLEATEEVPPIYGDADVDGVISANDAALVLQRVLDADTLTPVEVKYASGQHYIDVDASGSITANDAACILAKVLNDEFELPVAG